MIYLNNAATSFPKPSPVAEAVTRWLASPPVGGSRSGFGTSASDLVSDTRAALADFLHAPDPSSVFFTSGATASLNTVIRGLPLAGRHVVTTTIEHNSVLRPLARLERAGDIRVSMVDSDADGHVPTGVVADALRDDTALVAVNHCSNVTGATTDVRSIVAAAHGAGALVLVDASQSVGAHPIDVTAWGADFVACAGHKSLFGLPGTGVLYVRPGIDVEPLMTGGTGIRSDLREHPSDRPLRYEAGTPNLPGIAAIQAGLQFIVGTGMATISDRVVRLVDRAYQQVRAHHRVRCYGRPPATDGRMLSLTIDGVSCADAAYVLESACGIVVRAGLHCAPLAHRPLGSHPSGTLRVSPSWFTTADEVDAFANAVLRIAEGMA